MSWDIAILAVIELDAARKEAWSKLRFDASRYDDSPADVQTPGAPPASFDEIVEDLRSRANDGPLGVRAAKDKIELAVVLSRHDFQYRGPRLATAFRDGADLGGKGRVDFVGFHTSDAFRSYAIGPDVTSMRDVDASEHERMLVHAAVPLARGGQRGRPGCHAGVPLAATRGRGTGCVGSPFVVCWGSPCGMPDRGAPASKRCQRLVVRAALASELVAGGAAPRADSDRPATSGCVARAVLRGHRRWRW
ncbi:MAG: hypothetical protein WKG00_09925 [Polyangiaceae bacterium]